VIVFEHGTKIAEGPPDEIKANPLVIKAYLGEEES
jgi:branched-chain amino acid transport system ATP-binding protein